MMSGTNLTRRDFLKIGPTAVALGVAGPALLAQTGAPALEYKVLGRTGLRVTTVSLGCMVAPEEVIAMAGDLGINWFDTAHGYKGGRNEAEVGRALEGKRDRVHISTKLRRGSAEEMMAQLETSLTRLQTDHVDMLMVHALSSRAQVLDETTIAALERAKEEGKTRFLGLSTHSNMAECINSAVEAKVYDAVLTTFNYTAADARLTEAVENAGKAGVGIIAMKTQLGDFPDPQGGLTPHQAALRWVLENPHVACAVPGTRDFTQLEQNVAVMGRRLSAADRRELENYAAATRTLHCTGCAGCDTQCPRGVNVPEVRRCAMYLEGYRDPGLARENYLQLAGNAAPCGDCASCVVSCARGTRLQPLLSRVHRHLA
jgi:uncharacterized protein